ncbi:MAG: cell division protein ZapB [Treponema sp.]|jgi:FtsZ-binding cell division protein ZapB|nr:cell division protein ZapB [Treponema sp.]
MGTLEHVKLLEAKVVKVIDFIKRLTNENDQLKDQLDSYQKRVDELEALIQSLREEQDHIQEGILSALNRFNRFDDVIDKSLVPSASASQEEEDEEPPSVEILAAVEEILAPVYVPKNSETTGAGGMDTPVQEQQPSEGEVQPQ